MDKDKLNDIAIQSIALSSILLEKFEIMIENGLLVHKTKQSVKTSLEHLKKYVNEIFIAKIPNPQHFIQAADVVIAIGNRIEKALSDEEIVIISDRKTLLRKVIIDAVSHNTNDKVIDSIMEEVERLGLLKF